MKLPFERFWLILSAIILLFGGIFVRHLMTAVTPDSVAFMVPFVNMPIYWYGVIIMGGILLGCYVGSRIALRHSLAVFEAWLTPSIEELGWDGFEFSAELRTKLEKRAIHTPQDLIYRYGGGPEFMGLTKSELSTVSAAIDAHPTIHKQELEQAPWHNWTPDHVWGMLMWAIVLGVIGARIYHIFTPSPSLAAIGIESAADYFRQPLQMLNLRNGGLGIYGAMVGGVLGVAIYARRRRINLLNWLDMCAIAMPIGQFVGRWANFFNQELYGGPSDLPWAIWIDRPLSAFIGYERFHPTFLYEALWSLGTFFVIYWLATKRWESLLSGELATIYLVFYGIGRLLLEFVRLDSNETAGISTAALVSIGIIAFALVFMLTRRLLGMRVTNAKAVAS